MSKARIFYQPSDGYCYNSDTILLYDFAKSQIKALDLNGRVLEVGSGCGVLGILLAQDIPIAITQIDKQNTMAWLTKKNAYLNGVASEVLCVDFVAFECKQQFDAIITNPPFYHPGTLPTKNPHLNICRLSTHLPLKDFMQKAHKCLTPQGHLILCYDARQIDALLTALSQSNFKMRHMQLVQSKPQKNAHLVLIHAQKNSKALSEIRPTMILREGDKFSQNMQDLYVQANTYTIKAFVDVNADDYRSW